MMLWLAVWGFLCIGTLWLALWIAGDVVYALSSGITAVIVVFILFIAPFLFWVGVLTGWGKHLHRLWKDR